MPAEFTAATEQLDELRQRLERASSNGLRELYELLAEEGRTLVVEQFERQGDPYGNAWAPRKAAFGRRTGGQILRDTARFQNSFVARPTADGFEIGSNFVGARVLTLGAVITPKRAKRLAVPLSAGGVAFLKSVTIPGRRVIPTGEAGPIWGPRLIETIEDFGAYVVAGNR